MTTPDTWQMYLDSLMQSPEMQKAEALATIEILRGDSPTMSTEEVRRRLRELARRA